MKSVVRLALVLFIVCALAAASLALVAEVTSEPIAEQARRETQEALRAVLTRADDFAEIDEGRWDALERGTKIGEVLALTAKGYSGPIRIVVGLDAESRITAVRVITQTETPGLGTKVAETPFLGQFQGKQVSELTLKKDDPVVGSIDAVTAATISSRAVTDGIRRALGGR